jgi:glycosyltransferase involved in cell wall biosynthesis
MQSKKIVLISYHTPTIENVRGPSALPYHLLVERDESVEVVVYTFNANGLSHEQVKNMEQRLNVKIHCLPMPAWYQWMMRLHLLFLRIILPLPYLCYLKLSRRHVDVIKGSTPDFVWIYGEELIGIVRQMDGMKRVHLGPDTESLYYYRMLGRRFVMNDALDYWKCAMMYRKYARMERELPSDENYTFFAVGEEDVRHLQQLNPKVNAKFMRHPHYEVSKLKIENGELKIKFHQPKIKLLIAGRYDLYMQQAADELFEELKNGRIEKLRNQYSITFLGKGWEKHVERLRQAGWDVQHITFAPDYVEEITKHDIQITPIAIGTGTKGKVLDALANGLLVIGTSHAMENIAVENGVSCIEYHQPQEVIKVLKDILANRAKYEAMAKVGQEAVLKWHDRELLAREVLG